MDRRHFITLLGRTLPAGVVLSAAAGTYAVEVEPSWIEVRKVLVPVPHLPRSLRGLRIVQLSDIHRSEIVPGSLVEEAVDMALSLRPELIALTGDFITSNPVGFKWLAKELAPLGSAAPAFAVPGNHDYAHIYQWARPGLPDGAERLGDALALAGIELIRNEQRSVSVRDGAGSVELVGIDDFWSPNFDPDRAFARAGVQEPGTPRLVLCHNPDGFRYLANHPFDLMLSGHTHGGQVRLPLLGAPVVPVEDRRFIAGLVPADRRLVYVNRGLGYNRKIRFGVRPEITLVELHAA